MKATATPLILLTLFLTVGFFVQAAATEPVSLSFEPQQAVVVLHNDQVIEGKVTRAGDFLHVVNRLGETRIRNNQVALVCGSLEEAYAHRRALVQVGNLYEHLDLAAWCLDNRLFDAAEQELSDARAVDSGNLKVAYLTRRLEAVRCPSTIGPMSLPTLPMPDKKIDQPDTVWESIPRRLIERFTTEVHPILLNNCTTGGCHIQGHDSSFQLRRSSGRLANRRITQDNLEATLRLIDRDHPEKSPLLTVNQRPHPGRDDPTLAQRHKEAYRHLVVWVYGVARSPRSKSAPFEDLAATAATQPPATQVVTPQTGETGPSAANGKETAPAESWLPADAETITVDLAAKPKKASSPKRAELPKKFEPADPFDPEIFNRRYFDAAEQK